MSRVINLNAILSTCHKDDKSRSCLESSYVYELSILMTIVSCEGAFPNRAVFMQIIPNGAGGN